MGFHLKIKTDYTKELVVDIVQDYNNCELNVRFLPTDPQLTAPVTETRNEVSVSNEEKESIYFHASKSMNTVFEVKDTQPTHNKVSYTDINFQREKGTQSLYVRASKSENVIYDMNDLVCTKDTMRSNYNISFHSKEFQSKNRKQSLSIYRSKSESEIFNMNNREDHGNERKPSLCLHVSKSESTIFVKKNSKNTKDLEHTDNNMLELFDDRPDLAKIRKRYLYLRMSKSTSAISDMINVKYIRDLECMNKVNVHDGLDFKTKKWQRSLYLNKSKSTNAILEIKNSEYRNKKAFCSIIPCQPKAEKLFCSEDSKSPNVKAKDSKYSDNNTLCADTFNKANELMCLRSTKSIGSRIDIKGFGRLIKSALCYNLYKEKEQEETQFRSLNIRKLINNSHEPKNLGCLNNNSVCGHYGYDLEEKEYLCSNVNNATSTAFENEGFACFSNTDSSNTEGRKESLASTSNEDSECSNNTHCQIEQQGTESPSCNANNVISTVIENDYSECVINRRYQAKNYKKSCEVSRLIRIDDLMSVLKVPDNTVVGQKNINNEK